jgi:PEP-CTERM motif-containing protein
MHLRPLVVSCIIVFALIASHNRAEGSAILFNDRTAFNAALNGDYELFTEFDFTHVGGMLLVGNYAGVRVAKDVNVIGFGEQLSSGGLTVDESQTLDFTFTEPVSAIGFDVVRASYSPIPAAAGGPIYFPTDVEFSFGTVNGLRISTTLAPGSFIGALLIDDVFSDLFHGSPTTLRATHPNDAPYFAGFAIDNLAVQPVPEPSTLLLVSGGIALLQGCRFLRRK